MFARTGSMVLLVLVTACGPEAGIVPRTGVYEVTIETVDSDCPQDFGDGPPADAIVFTDGALTVGFADFPVASKKAWAQSWVYATLERDAAGEGFVAPAGDFFDTWFEVDGCRFRRGIVVELPGAEELLTRVTYEWADAGACAWLRAGQAGCAMIRETTSTLREACEGCDLDAVRERLTEDAER